MFRRINCGSLLTSFLVFPLASIGFFHIELVQITPVRCSTSSSLLTLACSSWFSCCLPLQAIPHPSSPPSVGFSYSSPWTIPNKCQVIFTLDFFFLFLKHFHMALSLGPIVNFSEMLWLISYKKIHPTTIPCPVAPHYFFSFYRTYHHWIFNNKCICHSLLYLSPLECQVLEGKELLSLIFIHCCIFTS